MTRLVVEVGFGSTVTTPAASITWTDITERVDVLGTGVAITRGRQDEQSDIQPGTCSLTLDNSDGRFTSGLASSPYYPNVKKNVPIRVRAITTAKNLLTNPSFESGVTAWTSSGVPTRATSTTHVQHGTQAMLITWGATAGQTMTSPKVEGLDIGTTYTFSAYVWVPAGNATVQLAVVGGSSGSASSTFGAFQRISVTWTATATTHQVQVKAVGTPTAGHQVWVDAGQVEEGGAATTFDSDGAQSHPRFWGMVNEWPTRWDGLYASATITCADIFKRLSRAPALRSMLTEEVFLDAPLAYYPLTEPSDSTAAGDISGTTAGPLSVAAVGSGGELAFGGDSAGPDQLGALTLTPATISNGQFLTGDLGADYESRSSSAYIFHEGWFSTTTAARVICGLSSVDNRYQIIYSLEAATGRFTIEATSIGGTRIASTPATPNLADGAWHQFVYDEQAQQVWVDGVAYSVGVEYMSRLRQITVGSFTNSRLYSGLVAHLAFYAPAGGGSASTYTAHYTTGTTAHVGETADVRAARIASYVGTTVTTSGTVFGALASQAALGSSPLTHLQEVETTEGGVLIAARDSASLLLQSRDVRYNPTSSLSLAYADLDTNQVQIADDDQKLVNTVIASRPGGATQRVKNDASRTAYGPYEQTLNVYKQTDLQVVDAAQWMINRFADPPPEIRQMPLEAYTLPLATYRALLNADVSSVVDLTGMPSQAPASAATVTVEGYTETIRYRQHSLDFHTSRTDTATVWVLGSSTYGVLGLTTRLAY